MAKRKAMLDEDDLPLWVLGILGALSAGAAAVLVEKWHRDRARKYPCWNCHQLVQYKAPVCPHCGATLDWSKVAP